MESSESQGRLIDRARAARLRKRKKSNSSDGHASGQEQRDNKESIPEEKCQTLAENIPCAVYSAFPGRTGPTIFMSERWRDWTGYGPDELYQDPEAWPKCIHPDDRERAVNVYEGACKDATPYSLEYRVVHKDTGQVLHVKDQGILSRDEKEDVVRVDGIVTDITELKQAQNELEQHRDCLEREVRERTAELQQANDALRRSESRYKAVVENAGEGIVVVQDGRLQFFNPYVEATFGHTQEELKSRPFIEFVHPDDRDWVMDIHIRRFKGEEVPNVYEVRIVDEHGNTSWAENSGLLIEWCGRPATLNFLRDITDRKRAEEALRDREEMISALVETSRDWIWSIDANGIHTYSNPAVEEILGYSPDELIGKRSLDLMHEDDRRMVEARLPNWVAEKRGWANLIVRWRHKNGGYSYLESSAVPIFDSEGGLVGFRGVDRDITERKLTEEALKTSEQRLELAHDAGGMGMFDWDIVHDRAVCNEHYFRLFGLEPQEHMLSEEDWLTMVHPDDRERAQREVRQALEEKVPYDTEYRVVWPDNSVKWVSSKARVFHDDDARPYRMIGVMTDITERRRLEEAYRSLVDQSIQGLAIIQYGRIVFLNKAFSSTTGYSREDLLATSPEQLQSLVHPEDREMIWARHRDRLAGKPVPARYEFRWIRKDGSTCWVEIHASRIEYQGRPAIQAAYIDITERKQTEAALRQHADLLRESQAVARLGHYLYDATTGRWEGSEILNEIFGFGDDYPKTIDGWQQRLHPDEYSEMSAYLLGTVLEQGQPFDREYRIVRLSDNQVRWVHGLGRLEFDEGGKPVRMIGTIQDITERKTAEKALRENEEKYRRVVENQTEFIVRWLPGGVRTFVNDSYCRYFGISPDEAIGTSCWSLITEDFHRTLGEKIESLTPENPLSIDELRVVRADGTTGWNSWTTRALFNEQGELIEYQAVGRDITERRRAEEELRESQERFRHAFENSNVGMCLVDMGGIVTRVNSRMCGIFGYRAEQLQGMSVNDIAHPEDVNISPEFIRRSISGEIESIKFEKRYFHAEGHVVWCQVSSSLVRNAGGEPLYFISHVQDITERRKAHDAIEDRLQFERLLSSISSRFVNLPASEIDRAVEDGLGLIGWFFEVDRVSIGQFIGSEKEPRTTHCWLADGCDPESKTQAFDTVYSNMAARLIDEGKFVYEKLEDIPETWTQERQFVATTGLKAGLIVALRAGGMVIGAIGINSLQAERTWPDETAERLRLLADIFANALERKRVEYALIESEAKFKSLAEQSPNMIFINKRGRVVYANNRCEEVTGYERERFYSSDFDFMCLIAPESQNLIRENLARHMRGEELEPYDYSLIRKNGERIEAINASKLIQYEGETAILGIVTDITERKRAEKKLRESEQKFRSYIDNAPDGVVVVDSQGRLVEVNEAICNMTGYSKDELLDKSIRDMFAPESRETALQHFDRVIAEGWATGEYAYLRKNGSAGYWTVDAVKISENRFLAFVKDITDNKRAEEALRASEEKFRSIFETAPNLITSINEEGIIVDCNRRVLEVLGCQKEEVIGQSISKIIHPDCLEKAEKALQEILATGFSYNKEYKMVRKDGSMIDVSINSSELKDRNGRHLRTLCFIDNITDRKQAEQRILENRAQLKSLASQLSLTEERERRRLATELHDQIGQSLVISKIKLDQLRESAASDEFTMALEEVCHCLTQVIQDTRMLTFDLSSPILYELGFEAAVAEWLADEVRGKHGIQTEFEDDGQLKPLDEDIRALLFRNVRELLINIVKHARAGKVKVSLRKVDEHIKVTVEDDGVGFDPVEVRARAAQRAEFGLFSIRERLEQLGGQIEIESRPRHGSRISMIAPLKSVNYS